MTEAQDGRWSFHLTCPACQMEWDWWTWMRSKFNDAPERYGKQCPRCGDYFLFEPDDGWPQSQEAPA